MSRFESKRWQGVCLESGHRNWPSLAGALAGLSPAALASEEAGRQEDARRNPQPGAGFRQRQRGSSAASRLRACRGLRCRECLAAGDATSARAPSITTTKRPTYLLLRNSRSKRSRPRRCNRPGRWASCARRALRAGAWPGRNRRFQAPDRVQGSEPAGSKGCRRVRRRLACVTT